MNSPFKFLDAYTLEDKDVFFGRDEEVERLYEMVFKAPLILVYGMSGTGKTSLIKCGLASRFDGPDWLPLHVRRNANINDSLDAAIGEVLKDRQGSLVGDVSYIFRYYLRPVYFIFDQLEELFIMGDREEQMQFVESIKELVSAELACKVILVMREEYIGHLYHFEKVLPTIFDHRLRVEPMSNNKVQEVMLQSFDKFNIDLEPPVEKRCEEMIDNLSSEKSGIQLPYLQVYLDTLYRESFIEKYGEGVEQSLQQVYFSENQIIEIGNIEDVLEKFLLRQEVRIQHLLEKKEAIQQNFVRNLLDLFVTEDGTKHPLPIMRDKEKMYLSEKFQGVMPPVSNTSLSIALTELEKARLLRSSDETIELAHDSLAALIDQKRTSEQRQLNEVKRRIRSAHLEYVQSEEKLSAKQLQAVEEYLPLLNLKPSELEFIETSRKHIRYLEEQERLQREKEIQHRRRRKYIIGMSILSIIAVVSGIVAFNQYLAASEQRDEVVSQKKEVEVQRNKAEGNLTKLIAATRKNAQLELQGRIEKANGFRGELQFAAAKNELVEAKKSIADYERTLSELEGQEVVLDFEQKKDLDPMIAEVDDLLLKLPDFEYHSERGKMLWSNREYEEAYAAFQMARNTGIYSEELNEDIEEARQQGILYYKELGQSHYQSGTNAGFVVSNDFLNKVIKLGGGDDEVHKMLEETEKHISENKK